ncbi:class I SAM-dependent methyltransferase [Sphingomonas immobilis]|uniref:Methyltransferase n=1 Tax=Sphingomonas immobilis TaxID=3063997 RepID=A0ABT8ZV21_9SPHN|nr:methyltransferase [Sphingomonas sp. CA1-15]MDO7841425.1 methyltransferase [Sphingomonas sp. CA1-15]
MRFGVTLAAIAALSAPVASPAKDSASPVIAKALADPARADAQADDARRQAAALVAFSGLKPGQSVVDFFPGGGYWTRIFTGVVGPKGHVYAIFPAAAAQYATKSLPALQARGLANVAASVDPAIITVPAPVDLVWTVENYHDIPNKGAGEAAITAVNAAAFAALKPGGLYVVVDHAAPAGSGLADTETTHRIDPAIVKKQVLAAGFQWVGESKALANPADDHTLKVFDPAIRGHTDQFIYKFRKPK